MPKTHAVGPGSLEKKKPVQAVRLRGRLSDVEGQVYSIST